MTTPSAYEYGQQFAANRGAARDDSRDRSAMDDILQNVSQAKNAQEYDTAIRQVFRDISPARQKVALDFIGQQRKQKNEDKFFGSLPGQGDQQPHQNNENMQNTARPIAPGEERRGSNEPGMQPQMNNGQPPGVNPISQQPQQYTPEHVLGAAKISPPIAGAVGRLYSEQEKKIADQEKAVNKQSNEDRKYHSGISAKAVDKADGLRESIPKKENALALARDAIQTDNLSFFSKDKLANITGFEAFRSAKGAQLNTAAKENLLSNMSRVSSRAQNMWFEQRLNSMFPQIGNSREANLTIQEMLEGEVALDKAYIGEFDRLSTQDREKYGYVRDDIEKRARDASKPIEKDIFDRTMYRTRQIYEKELGKDALAKKVTQVVPSGTPLTVEMAQIFYNKFGKDEKKAEAEAKKHGYRIPTAEEVEIYRQAPRDFQEGL